MYHSMSPVGFWVTTVQLLAPLAVLAFNKDGVVTPLNPFLFVGEPLRLYCNITNPAVREDSSSLYFEKAASNLPDNEPRYNERRPSQKINTRVIRLTVPEVTLSDEGSYVCVLKTLEGKPKVVGHQWVTVDISPRKVINVECKVYNWETMTCTWELGASYKHPKHVNTSVVWVATDIQQDCPQLTLTSCHWDQQHYRHGASYNILIEVSYEFQGRIIADARKIITVDSDKIVEPAPVENLKAASTNSSCILLTWQVPNVFIRSKRFIQQIRAPNGNWTDISTGISTYAHQHNSSHESFVCDLEPHTAYDFRVALYPLSVLDGQRVGYTSQWRSVFARTDEDVPSAAPLTCPGCYFDLGDTSQESATPREVQVIWKDIPEAARNGRLTHYTVTYVGIDSNHNGTVICRLTDAAWPVTSAVLKLPSRHEDYHIRIVGATRKGESPQGSYILVPAQQKQPQPPRRFLVKKNKGALGSERLFLSWAALGSVPNGRSKRSQHHARSIRSDVSSPRRQSVTSLNIVWCEGSRDTWQCKGPVEWVSLPPKQVTYELVTDLTQVDPYGLLIGISVQEKAGASIVSSGIYWSTCVYTRDQKPETAPLNVRIAPTSTNDDSLAVVWERRGCREDTSYITEYLVRYCPSSSSDVCVGDRMTLNVSSDVTSATLPHLARSTKYLIHVVAASSAGLGPPSDDIWHILKPKPPDEDVSGLLAVVFSIMLAVFVIIFFVCCVRYCYRRKKKVPAVNKLLELPTPQKCPPVNHYRGRPLPEPPANDVLVDHHTYGTNSGLACMNNLGCDKKDNFTESGFSSQECTNSNTPLMAGHTHDINTDMGNGKAPHILPEKLGLTDAEDLRKPSDRDSVISSIGKIERTSLNPPAHIAEGYLRVGLADPGGSFKDDVPVAFSCIMHTPVALTDCHQLEGKDFSTTDTLPYRSHWSAFPNAYSQHYLHQHNKDLDFDPSTALFSSEDYSALSLAIAGPDTHHACPSYPLHSTENLPAHPWNGEAANCQDFCTCDCDSEDSHSDDLKENMSLVPSTIMYPEADRRPSIPIETIFSRIPPPPGPPSPAPPNDSAPPLPTDSDSRFTRSKRQQHRAGSLPGMGSQEYLEPQIVPNGYVFSVAS